MTDTDTERRFVDLVLGQLDAEIRRVEAEIRHVKEHQAAQLEAQDRLVQQMLADRDESVRLALEALQARLDLLNELKQAMADAAAKYAVREVVDAALAALSRRLEESTVTLSDRIAKSEAAISNLHGRLIAVGGFVGLIGVVATVIGVVS